MLTAGMHLLRCLLSWQHDASRGRCDSGPTASRVSVPYHRAEQCRLTWT